MSEFVDKIMVAVEGNVACIKVIGRANCTQSVDLKKLINELVTHGCKQFVFELSECVTMDSTFLGLLSGIGLQFQEKNDTSDTRFIELINPHPRILDVLETLGVAFLFKISTSETNGGRQFEPLQRSEKADRADVTRTSLEAHKTLMEINPENIQKFKDVAQFLAEDLKRLEGGDKDGK